MSSFKWAARSRALLSAGISVIMLVASIVVAPSVHAASYDDQIRALQQQNDQAQETSARLILEAADINSQISTLEAEAATLEPQIAETTAKSEQLQAEIDKQQDELKQQREVLGQNIRKMFIAGDMGMMEKLASSNSLSHYVDQEEYRERVRSQVHSSMKRIQEIEKKVAHDKSLVDKVLADQQSMQQRLGAQKVEKDRLLSLNGEQRAAEEQKIQENKETIAKLRSEQAELNTKGSVDLASSSQKNGGYPDEWQNTPFPNTLVDPWGMYKRQCVSYTAFKVAQSGRHMPYWGGRGNANQWDDNAIAAGIPVDTNPQVGDVAVSNAGQYGHVMYVEAVHGDGTITVSQYNADWTGNYSEVRRSAKGLLFIHFP